MKKYILIILFLFLGITVYSQNKYRISELTNTTKSAIDSLEEATNTLIKKDKKLRKMKGLKPLHIFWLPFRCNISKEEYLNKEFLHKLTPEYIKLKNKNYIETCEFHIYDSIGSDVAYGNYLLIYGYENNDVCNSIYKYLIKLSLNNEIDFVFKIDFFGGDYICVKDSDIFIIKEDKDNKETKDYDWKKYMNELYEKEIKNCNILIPKYSTPKKNQSQKVMLLRK